MHFPARVAALVLIISSLLYGQAEGEVESLGFGGYYRPDCWVPMLVRLRPTTDAPARLQIRVYQKDIDEDRVVTVRQISLTPGADGQQNDQHFWMYFRPQPQKLADPAEGGTLKNLAEQLKVVLCDESGDAIANLPLTQMARRVDLETGRPAGARVVLCVSEGPHQPTWRAYDVCPGASERPLFLITRLKDLPEDYRGYEMVDSIVWLNAQAPDPRKGTEEPKFRAIEEFVRRGGNLVVRQGNETSLTRGFESFLPVTNVIADAATDLTPLTQLMRLPAATSSTPISTAAAKAKPKAWVELEKQWPDGGRRTAYLARMPLGMGCVTWVAQDLTDSALARRLADSAGWARAWDRVLAWRNDPQNPPLPDRNGMIPSQPYGTVDDRGGTTQLGASLLAGGTLSGTVGGYLLVAVGFLLVYWVIAGPGASSFLTVRKRAHLNWFVFGGAAVAAAGLSVGVTRLVQARSVQLDHLTLVKIAPDMPAVVESRIGLYIPRDGFQRIDLKETRPRTVNWITPYPLHPVFPRQEGGFLAMKEYQVAVEDAASAGDPTLSVPYRRTQKQLEARWCGELKAQIQGKVTFAQGALPELYGFLTNSTGQDLKEIYLVFNGPSPYDSLSQDRVIYIPQWRAKETLELSRILDRSSARTIGDEALFVAKPGQGRVVEGLIEPTHVMKNKVRAREGWARFWYADSGAEGLSAYDTKSIQDKSLDYRFSLPLASLFQRVPPVQNQRDESGRYNLTRSDLVRLNVRSFDASSAVAAGQLLILAQAEKSPLPYPLEVEGERVAGEGVTIYQVVLPLERK